ncbi:MAG: NADH-quinone oxidoreductase subunit J [Acidimicrobiales bacterium]|nr:NADH-quinone oxidoreductase subunit J [Acidimicrobiales bacterium]
MTLLAAANGISLPGTDDPINVSQTVGFALLAALMIWAAIRVVTTRNVVHAAVWLVVVLAGAAAQFILLAAEFVGVTQVMVYIGAVIVLILFGVMLTQAKLGNDPNLSRRNWYGGAVVAVVLFGLLAFATIDTFEDAKLPEDRRMALPAAEVGDGEVPRTESNTGAVSDAVFGAYLLPLEVLGVLLTAALVGAIAVARKD